MVDRLKTGEIRMARMARTGRSQAVDRGACIFKCVECSVDVQLLFQVRQAKLAGTWRG